MCISGAEADSPQFSNNSKPCPALASPTRPLSSFAWRQYFLKNKANLRKIPWEIGTGVTDAELQSVCASVQEFQLGESSDGKRFIERATEYARHSGDWQYVESLRLFIAEEQRHGRELGRFLQEAGAPLLQRTRLDEVFRFLRHLAALELMIAVLVTAEIIAQVYYDALRAATESAVLRIICDQILDDEEEHVQFQCERLAILRRHRSRWYVATANFLQRMLLACTCAVLWKTHGRTFRAGGYPFVRFVQRAITCMDVALAIADPYRYAPELPDTIPSSHALPEAAISG